MKVLPGGIRQVTLPLPTRPGHVHAYLLPGDDGWTVVDTGVGLRSVYRPFIRYQRDPILVEPGEQLDGWEFVPESGHADGQLCLKDGVLVAADHLLARITPSVGLWPASRADPLGDYLAALERMVELEPRVALPGHGDVLDDPAGRARGLQEHHRLRLEETMEALGADPRTGFELSLALFGDD